MKKIQLIIIVTFISKVVFSQMLFFPFKVSSINTNKELYSYTELENSTVEKKLNIEFLDQLKINGKRIDSIKSEFKGNGQDWRLDHNAYFEYKNGLVDIVKTESYNDDHITDVITNIHQLSYTADKKVKLIETTLSSKAYGYSEYSRLIFDYNAGGKISQSTSYNYHDEWIPSMLTLFTYDSADISFVYNTFWYYEEQWARVEHKEFKLEDPDNLSSEYWHWYTLSNEAYYYYKDSYATDVLSDTSFAVTYSSINEDDNLYQLKNEYVFAGNNMETKIYRKYYNDTALSYFSNQEILFDELGRLLKERTFEYEYYPCDIEITSQYTAYTRNEIDPDTIIIYTDTVITEYIYENNKITIKNSTQWGADCPNCDSKKITTYYLSDDNTSPVDVEKNEMNDTKGFEIYPNPATSHLNLIVNNMENENAGIFDLSGKNLCNIAVDRGNNVIELPDLPKGIYVVKLFSKNQPALTAKLVIE